MSVKRGMIIASEALACVASVSWDKTKRRKKAKPWASEKYIE